MSLPRSDLNLSRFLSYILRHRPQDIDLRLDEEGWASIEDLIEKSQHLWPTLTPEKLRFIVEIDDKCRFAFSPDRRSIRASQGHSSQDVIIKLTSLIPPATLYHGTARKFMSSISEHGLQKQQRHHVHLSSDTDTASLVGKRRDDNPVILKIDAQTMHQEGYTFYLSENNVWLTERVPPHFLTELTPSVTNYENDIDTRSNSKENAEKGGFRPFNFNSR